MLNIRDPNLVQGPLHTNKISQLIFGGRSRESEFSDVLSRSAHNNVMENEYHSLTRNNGECSSYRKFVTQFLRVESGVDSEPERRDSIEDSA